MEDRSVFFGRRPTEQELAAQRRRNNPRGERIGPFTGRCSQCGSTNLWSDNLAWGCRDCDAFLGSN